MTSDIKSELELFRFLDLHFILVVMMEG